MSAKKVKNTNQPTSTTTDEHVYCRDEGRGPAVVFAELAFIFSTIWMIFSIFISSSW